MGWLSDTFKGITGGLFGDPNAGEARDSTTTSTPWGPLQPYLQDAYKQAQGLYQSGGPEYYPNATYVPFSPQTQMGMQLAEGRALYGSPYDEAAGGFALNALQGQNPYTQMAMGQLGGMQWGPGYGELMKTAGGNYLGGNPYNQAMFNEASRGVVNQFNQSVLPGMNATFGGAGRTGSYAHTNALNQAGSELSQNLGGMAANIFGQDYANERSRQLGAADSLSRLGLGISDAYAGLGAQDFAQRMGAANLGMGVGAQDWESINNLMRVGGMVEDQSRNVLGDLQGRFDYYQQRPETQFNNYTAWLSGIPGSQFGTTNTNVDQKGGSTFGNFLGNLAGNYFGTKYFGG